MSGANQVNAEYLEVIGPAAVGVSQLDIAYLEVIAKAAVTNVSQLDLLYIEVIGSMFPAAPFLSITRGPGGLITLTWAAVPGATGYEIFTGTSSGGETLATTTTSTSYTFTGTPGTRYYAYGITLTATGNSPAGVEVSTIALLTAPIQQLSPLLEDGGCLVAYFGGANQTVVWAVNIGSISPLTSQTDASGVALAYYNPQETGGLKLLEGGAGVKLLEAGAGRKLLEGTSGAITGTVVQITVQEY